MPDAPAEAPQLTAICPFCASVVGPEQAQVSGPQEMYEYADAAGSHPVLEARRHDGWPVFQHRCRVAGMVLHLYGDLG
jgi:hypothetical protein